MFYNLKCAGTSVTLLIHFLSLENPSKTCSFTFSHHHVVLSLVAVFYSNDSNDKICNYECVRYALSHQLDTDEPASYLTVVHLDDFDEQINDLKAQNVEYDMMMDQYRQSVQTDCVTKQHFTESYPWLSTINQQYIEYPKVEQKEDITDCSDIDYLRLNESVYRWKQQYDIKHPQNDIVFMEQYRNLFGYTIHSIMNADKLPRYNKAKHQGIIISFELQIGSLSYEQDIWLTPCKVPGHGQPGTNGNRIEYKKAIYKSKALRINTFPREIVLSVMVWGLPHSVNEQGPFGAVFDARRRENVPSWLPITDPLPPADTSLLSTQSADTALLSDGSNGLKTRTSPLQKSINSAAMEPDRISKLILEEPIAFNMSSISKSISTPSPVTPSSVHHTVHPQPPMVTRSLSGRDLNGATFPSYSKLDTFHEDNADDNRDYKGVFHRAFSECEPLGYVRIPLVDEFHVYRQGTFQFNLWDVPKWKKSKHEPRDPYGPDLLWRFLKPTSFPPTTTDNSITIRNQCQITITFGPDPENVVSGYKPPTVIAPLFNPVLQKEEDPMYDHMILKPRSHFTGKEYKEINKIVMRDPICPLTKKERLLIWVSREKFKSKPRAV